MNVKLFYIDDCPSWQDGLKNLEIAVKEEDLAASIATVKVTDDGEAVRLKFLGSPSFRIDGNELWPEERESYSLSCRLYSTPEGLIGFPTVGMLRKALRQFNKV
jgi:hypothetical protein